MRVVLLVVLLICSSLSQEEDPKGSGGDGSKSEPEETTPSSDYEDDYEADCEEGGLFEIFNKILCIFKMIIGLLTGNPDPCCPLEIPSFG